MEQLTILIIIIVVVINIIVVVVNEQLLKEVMNAKVDGKSARGRPRFGWMDGVKRALNDRRMDMREASECARNRNEW